MPYNENFPLWSKSKSFRNYPWPTITLRDPGQDYEAPAQDSGDAFSSVCSCVVFIKALYVSTAAERKDSSTVYLEGVVTAASL